MAGQKTQKYSLLDNIKLSGYTFVLDTASTLLGGRKALDISAEKAHPPKKHLPWYNESFYFNYFDNKNEVGGFIWIGKLPGQKMINAVQIMFDAKADAHIIFATEPYEKYGDEVSCQNMAYQCIEPLKKWGLKTKGLVMDAAKSETGNDPEYFFGTPLGDDAREMETDLTWTGLGPCHNARDYSGRYIGEQMIENNYGLFDLAGVRKIASEHYEQSGIVKGIIKLGDKTINFDGLGHRDHSWGVRDWFAASKWIWLSVTFSPTLSLNFCRINIGKIELFMGHVFRDGKNYPNRKCSIETEFEADGKTQKSIRFNLEDAGGFKMSVTGEVLQPVKLSRKEGENEVLVTEALTRYKCNDMTALGISEYLFQVK